MRICGDNFAVASEQGLYISVWNWKSGEHVSDFAASLRASVFTFLDEYHILFPSSIDDGLYVYDIRAMPPINSGKQKLKGTHCFEITIPQFCGSRTVCNITLESNSLTMGSEAAAGLFYMSADDRMISLRFTVGPNPRNMHASWGKDYREIHVHARSLLVWTQAHLALPNTCVTVPWWAWSASAARVVTPRKEDGDVVYIYPSHSRFSGCGMRIISAAFMQSDGTAGVSIADYHPGRVVRGLKKEFVRHTHASQTEIGTGFRCERDVVNVGQSYPSVHDGTYSGLRSECLPLSRAFGTPSCTHSISATRSATEVIKDLFMLRWYGPPQELEKAPIMRVRRKPAKKMQFLEKFIPLPKEFRFDTSQPVFNVLCEDAVMFYTLVPESNAIRCAYWYTF